MSTWRIFQGSKEPHDRIEDIPPPPKWREFHGEVVKGEVRGTEEDRRTRRRWRETLRGRTFEAGDKEKDLVNAALCLRRPLLVTGKPGVGKSSLAYAVAYELSLGSVLYWPITTRTTLKHGLYHYDAIGRLQEHQSRFHELQIASLQKPQNIRHELSDKPPDIGHYLRLGALGTALLPSERPRVLLIDEIDKSDIDLPNDLLNIFEEGEFEIPELSRMSQSSEQVQVLPHDARDDQDKVTIRQGRIICKTFPFIVLTSNAERELPAPFLRRCLRLDIMEPGKEKLAKIVQAHFGEAGKDKREELIKTFLERRVKGDLANDQLLNAVYLTTQNIDLKDRKTLSEAIFRHLRT